MGTVVPPCADIDHSAVALLYRHEKCASAIDLAVTIPTTFNTPIGTVIDRDQRPLALQLILTEVGLAQYLADFYCEIRCRNEATLHLMKQKHGLATRLRKGFGWAIRHFVTNLDQNTQRLVVAENSNNHGPITGGGNL